MAIYSRLTTDPLMRPKFSDSSPLDKPLFADGADGAALHADTFETDGKSRPSRSMGNTDSSATSRGKRSKMLAISKASRNPGAAEKLRKRGAPNPTRGA